MKKQALKALTARFTPQQIEFILSNPLKSALLRELLQAHMENTIKTDKS